MKSRVRVWRQNGESGMFQVAGWRPVALPSPLSAPSRHLPDEHQLPMDNPAIVAHFIESKSTQTLPPPCLCSGIFRGQITRLVLLNLSAAQGSTVDVNDYRLHVHPPRSQRASPVALRHTRKLH